MSFIIILLKFNDSMFISLFKQWVWLAVGVFTVYTGGNIGQKFSRRNDYSNNYKSQQDPEYYPSDQDGA